MVGETKKKLLITGSSGMLGLVLARELSEDYELIGLDLSDFQPSILGSFITADITDAGQIDKAFNEIRPAIVIHTAAWTNVDGCEQDEKRAYNINGEGTRNIAKACKRYNAVLFYISTDFIFDGEQKTAYREEDRPNPINIYGKSKLAGEKYVQEILKEYFIIRASWLFGPHTGRSGNFVDTVLELAKKKDTLKIVDDQFGKPTYSIDLAGAIHNCLCSDAYGIYHITNSGSCSWYEFAKLILAISSIDKSVLPIKSSELTRAAKRPRMSALDNAKYKRIFGTELRNWQEALKDYINFPLRKRPQSGTSGIKGDLGKLC